MSAPPCESGCTEDNQRPPLARILGLFALSRLGIWIVGLVSLLVVAKGSYYISPVSPLDCFYCWDARWYHDIAQNGYHGATVSGPSNAGFLPLYSWSIYAASLGVLNVKVVGYLVSNVCLFGACVWLWRAAARETGDPRIATRSVVFLLAGPVSFFFSTLYAESLFLLLVIGSLDSARCQRWFLAGLLGALAALTRLVGAALVVPLVWQYFETLHHHGRGLKSVRLGPLGCCVLPFAGTLVFAAIMNTRFSDPLFYFRTQSEWGRTFSYFWDLFATGNFRVLMSPFYQVWFAGAFLVA
jgi:Gpi18-like mannosyltransferase